ncbi:hypothetical protein TPHA_0D04260 [Tetrapisispora phaffii CBS 4417]|uniref:UBC core domain-containing protein n=1 Tax=Tetrapisispora phaffii (strain ATCC 24235 / CBS 4417 / NBRC 1672 / NRRL Y-8282 / UCD 70-5) TaxID=1071381 RepID=G8BRY5_TETPH|nr:hypothetical protein TPHA_0D04260 [Tetrapisispora phaffii CBS 4417]CCE63060.1 hypothetical protein TPHA_0D04260 [Tetrapisispora phaffii CBS 4417]
MSLKRLLKEKRLIEKELSGYSESIELLEPVAFENFLKWRAVLKGPVNTPYHKHSFKLLIELPSEYPLVPPAITFEPYSMPHCNVEFSTGKICLNILEHEHWSPVWNLMYVMVALYQLLQEPVVDSPLNIDLANILRAGDTSAYHGLINYYLQEDTATH